MGLGDGLAHLGRPDRDLSPALVKAAVDGVIEAAVWQAPRFQALALGLEAPPPWPRGKDPALGLLWPGAGV